MEKKNVGWACVLFNRTQRSAFFCVLFQKNVVFFYVLSKRMLRSLRSFTFFWVSLVAKNSKKEHKRTLRALKECKRMMRSERKRTQYPTLAILH